MLDIFKLKENKSSVKIEVLGGLSTFVTMIYIIPVNAHIMSAASMPLEALICATSLVSAIACIFCGLFSNTPIALSVGMGMNAYFAFAVCLGQNIAWQSALAAVFLSGFIFLLLSFTKFRSKIIKSIPKDLILAICAGIGLFIAFIGLSQMKLIVKNENTLISLGDLSDPYVLLGLFTLFLLILFYSLKIRASFILAVLISSIIAWIFNINNAYLPSNLISLPNFSASGGLGEILFKIDFYALLELSMIPIVLTFFVTQLFDSIGTISGVGARIGLFEGQKGEKKLEKALLADATSSTCSSFFGTSTVTAFVESSAGVESGARTGLSAVVVGLCFLLSLFLLPLFEAIPKNVVYPVLVMVGFLMFCEVKNINFKDKAIAISSFFIIIMMPLSYSITTGFAFGFLAYVLMCIFTKRRLNLTLLLVSFIALLVFVLSLLKI